MIRTQIQLTEEQANALKELATLKGLSMAELIRRSVTSLLQSEHALRDERRRRAIAIAGRYRSGHHDVAEEHDKYLAEDFLA